MNEYLLPDFGQPYVINFSGGRSSAYMTLNILEAHGGLPDNAMVIFTNTGKEREETLEFIERCAAEWDIHITWLEYEYRAHAKGGKKDLKNVHRVVDFDTASRDGEPFNMLLSTKKMLPNVVTRMCTSELKVKTVERYMKRDLGIKKYTSVLGMRFDEKNRVEKAMMKSCNSIYPLYYAKVLRKEVNDFWNNYYFDLAIDSIEGNCDLCFQKREKNLLYLIRKYPERAEWWMDWENTMIKRHDPNLDKPEMARFVKEYTYADLLRLTQTQPELNLLMPDDDDVDTACYFCGD